MNNTKKKMLTKGVTFNPDSKRHMEIYEWIMGQTNNFSSFVREMMGLYYELNKQQQNNPMINNSVEYKSIPDINIDFRDMT